MRNALARARDFALRLRTPLGRQTLVPRMEQSAWPLMRRLAALHRRTISRHCRVVGVTGSLGKSTAARATAVALGLPLSRAIPRNSRSMIAHALLRIRPTDRYAVAEIGIARPRQMETYSRMVRPDVAVVTLIAGDHHQSMGDLLTTRREKCELVRALPPRGLAVLNGDDPNVMWMAQHTQARVITYGFGRNCDVRGLEADITWPEGTRVRIAVAGREHAATVRLIGRHSLMCLLAGLAVAVGEGVDPETALRRLSRLPPAPERMEVLALSNGATAILDTFKGSVESFHAALSALGEVPGARRVAVLGEVESLRGRRGPTYRDLGRRTARAADVLFTVSINATRLSSGARSAGMDPGQIIKSGHHARDALDDLRNVLRPGDAVLFKARGSQHLGRLAFALAGRKVRCWVDPCKVRYVGCAQCPMLGRGWEGLPLLF